MDERQDKLLQKVEGELQAEPRNKVSYQRNNHSSYPRPIQNRTYGKTLAELWTNTKRTYQERAERGKPYLPTGIKWIDELTDGLHKGEVWAISGRAASGKTTLAINIAKNIADEGKSVLFISLEMTGEQLVSRMFCEAMGFDHNRLRVGDFGEGFDLKDKTFLNFINSIDFEIMEKGYKISDIIEILETDYEDSKPDLIVLDFVQLIDKEGQDDRLALDEFMRKITELAKTHQLAILIISQLRRLPSGADMNKEPDLQDNRGSSFIEQLAHVCLIIYKIIEKQMGKTTEKIMIKIAKNRHGPTGEREMLFKGNMFRFEEINQYQEQLYSDN